MTRVKVEMQPVNRIVARLGVDKNGDVQRFVTNTVNHRMTRYMPFRSGALSTKLKFVSGPNEITVLGPYARYQYYGKVMVGPAPKQVTDIPLNYRKHKHPLAGPLWDKRMMAAEGALIAGEIQMYVNRRRGT